MRRRSNSPPEIVEGFVWASDRERPVSMPSFPEPVGDYALLWWHETERTYRVPCKQVAWLSQIQFETLKLKEGDRVGVRRSTKKGEDWEVVHVHGIPVGEWLFEGRREWKEQPSLLREFVPSRPPQDDLMALYSLLFPVIKGTSTIIAGPPGSDKSRVTRQLIRQLVGKKIIIQAERASERGAYPMDDEHELWVMNGDLDPSDIATFVEFALRTVELRAPYENGLIVVMDSLVGYAQALNMVTGSSGKTLSGGLDPELLRSNWAHLSLARHVPDGRHVTMLLVFAYMDSMSEGMVEFLKAKTESRVSLGDGCIAYTSLVVTRDGGFKSTLHRKVEEVVGFRAASFLWSLYNTEKVPSGRPPQTNNRLTRDQWMDLAACVREQWVFPMSPRTLARFLTRIWEQWPAIVKYDGKFDVFSPEIDEEVQTMLRRRKELEAEEEEAERIGRGTSPLNRASESPEAKGRKGARDRRMARQAAAEDASANNRPQGRAYRQAQSSSVPQPVVSESLLVSPIPASVNGNGAVKQAEPVEAERVVQPEPYAVVTDDMIARLAANTGADYERAEEAARRAAQKLADSIARNVTEDRDDNA